MIDKQPLTDSQIASSIMADLSDGITFADTTLSTERTQALEYYYGNWPKRLNQGSSGYRSLDVYDQVETARSILLETFLGNELPVRVVPGRNKLSHAIECSIATAYVNDVLFGQNEGSKLLDQVVFDGLTARIGAVRVDAVTERVTTTKTLPPMSMDLVDDIAADENVLSIEVEQADNPDEWIPTVKMAEDKQRVKITPMRPEDFLVNTSARDLYEYPCAHRLTKRMSQWKKEGYPEDKLLQALTEDEQHLLAEAQTRNDSGAETLPSGRTMDPAVTLIDAYTYLDIEQDGNPAYYRVLLAGQEVLEKEEVSDHPFVVYVPLRVSHIFHGVQFTKTIIPTANAKTALTRSVIDHAIRTNNPRWTVLKGTLTSYKELLENKLGGVVNVAKPDGIGPLPQPSLNPFVFETIRMLDTDLSDTTGVSRLSQGVDKDAVSKQNSRGMLQDVMRASETRLRVMARRFADGFLKELAAKIYETAASMVTEPETVVVDGEERQIHFAELPARADIRVHLELGPAQKEMRIKKIVDSLTLLSQDPQLGQAMSYDYKRRMAVEALKLQGFSDAEMALAPEPPPPSPQAQEAAMIRAEAAKTSIEVQRINAQAAMMKAETDRLKAIGQLDAEAQRMALQQQETLAKLSIEERRQAFNEAAATYEKGIIQQKMDSDPESVKAIAAIDS